MLKRIAPQGVRERTRAAISEAPVGAQRSLTLRGHPSETKHPLAEAEVARSHANEIAHLQRGLLTAQWKQSIRRRLVERGVASA